MKYPLDIYDDYPKAMKNYLQYYGWNFNKKACDFATSRMWRKGSDDKKEKIKPLSKEEIDEMLTKHGVKVEHNEGYNYVFVANMGKADYPKSIPDEMHLAWYIKEVIDDPDNEGGNVFRKWYADMVGKGEMIDWEDLK